MSDLSWLSRIEYPFKAHYFDIEAGRMHYVDEGSGPPVVMVHGTPTWSFLYRHLIKELMVDHRCLAPDLPGFGLSDRDPAAVYTPELQAVRFADWVQALGLPPFTLVVHDIGGPIALHYALAHPGQVQRIVVANSWLGSLASERHIVWAARLSASRWGRWLVARWFMPSALGRKLSRSLHRHYTMPLPVWRTRDHAHHLIEASAWFDQGWQQRRALAQIPALVVWGMKDTWLRPHLLDRWQQVFDQPKIVRLPRAGHFVQEEAVEAYGRHIRDFLLETTLSPNPG
ncbi:MAG: alpha/beta fold hydrolase [Bacteroidia bacterium]